MKLRLSRRHALLGLAIAVPAAATAKTRLPAEARIGAWVQANASPRDLHALQLRIAAADIQASLRSRSPKALEPAMAGDFEADRTMLVEGWVLSQTECALYVASLEKALS